MFKAILYKIFIGLFVGIGLFVLTSPSIDKNDTQLNNQRYYTSVKMPKSISFAGEKVPITRFDVRESLEREMLSNAYFHSQTIRLIKLAPRYFPVIEPILIKNNIPTDFKYLAVAESGFDERAVSPSNAVGFWQFLRGTAKEYGMEVNKEIDERYHIEKSTQAACKYFKKAYEKYGNWTMVAASYNAGMNGINRQIERQKEHNYYNLLLNEETKRYLFRILALKTVLENPKDYQFNIKESEKYKPIDYNVVVVDTAVTDFASFAKQHKINYKLLKDFNPWLRDTYLKNTKGKRYKIKIPQLD